MLKQTLNELYQIKEKNLQFDQEISEYNRLIEINNTKKVQLL